MRLEFNKDGSLKLPDEAIRNQQKEGESIVLRRVQVNINNPAIAQLKIECPENMVNSGRISNYYRQIGKKKFKSVKPTTRWVGNKTFVIEARGSKYICSLLEYLIKSFKFKLKNESKIIVTGTWDKFFKF